MPQLKDVRPGTMIKTVRGGSYVVGHAPTNRQADELRDIGFDFVESADVDVANPHAKEGDLS